MTRVRTERVQELLSQFQPRRIPSERRIFANRTLRMSGVELIGFDMDYTLAQYHVAVEDLAIRLTMQALVEQRGYAEEILGFEYDPEFAIRGLVVDKRHGTLLKMDTHRHIARAFRGLEPLDKRDRRSLYRDDRLGIGADRCALIDTAFAVPEAWLFARLVDLLSRTRGRALAEADYVLIFDDIRQAIDGVHADQSLKDIIRADLSTYIARDPELAPTLQRLRAAGKRLFLMTNSYGSYTDAVMSYLLNGELDEYGGWRSYFDIVVVGSRKPLFFTGDEPFFRLDEQWAVIPDEVTLLEPGAVYQGGNIRDFESLCGTAGDRILYVGDNMYGDILRSKKASTWRTAMLVPELERELQNLAQLAPEFERLAELETRRSQLDREIHRQSTLIGSMNDFRGDRHGEFSAEERRAFKHALRVAHQDLEDVEGALHECLAEIHSLDTRIERAFNPNWGMLLKSRHEHSLFGGQVEDYACLYTSRVANFCAYSPFQYFRTPRDLMPHEHPVP